MGVGALEVNRVKRVHGVHFLRNLLENIQNKDVVVKMFEKGRK